MTTHKQMDTGIRAEEGIMSERARPSSLAQAGRPPQARPRWSRGLLWPLALLLLLAMAGCFKPNYRYCQIGNIQLVGLLHTDKANQWKAEYTQLDIGDHEHVIADLPQIYLELDDGQMLFLPDVTVSQLAESGWRLRTPESEDAAWMGPARGISYHKQGCRFHFIDSDIVHIGIVGYETASWPPPILWGPDREKAHPFPLSEEDVAELFGEGGEVIDRVLF